MNKKILFILGTAMAVIGIIVGASSVLADQPTVEEASWSQEMTLEEYFWWAPVDQPKGCEFPVQVVDTGSWKKTTHTAPHKDSWAQVHFSGTLEATGNGQTLDDRYAQNWRCDDPDNCGEFNRTTHGKSFLVTDQGEGKIFVSVGTLVIKNGEVVFGAGQVRTHEEFYNCYLNADNCHFQKAVITDDCRADNMCRFYALLWERWSEAYCSVLRD
jgi:hypothetical protein